MTINTKFNVGEQVYFLHSGCVYLRPVHKIHVEVTKKCGLPPSFRGVGEIELLVTYFFVLNPNSSTREEIYKYENELGASKEDLMNTLQVL